MNNKLINTAISAFLALTAADLALADTNPTNPTNRAHDSESMKGMEKCYGIARAGMNECASATESCGSKSTVDGAKDAWIAVPKGVCKKIVGGGLAPDVKE